MNFKDRVRSSLMINKDELEEKIDVNKPHLSNLNEDPILNGKIKYNLN